LLLIAPLHLQLYLFALHKFGDCYSFNISIKSLKLIIW